ncbi:MAG: biopolymer transporter ExbD [Moraxellaceae bacterium]|nr:biopolymer transporter ExbD [Moraxellaceae bacterium]MDZ4298516.1 biopolymer transporter ExbD [Moraxellaceae bacterium]MDZ4387496.1 biopolymer transporter ExbD [Moraxellaceae bacterium]
MKLRRPQPDQLELNLAPLIDCLLFIVIFFLLSTTFAKTGKLQIQLPEADAQVSVTPSQAIDVAIDASGQFAVNGQVLSSSADLSSAVLAAAGDKRDLPFIITADGKAPHQAVVTAMNLAGQLGFRNLGIGTQSLDSSL